MASTAIQIIDARGSRFRAQGSGFTVGSRFGVGSRFTVGSRFRVVSGLRLGSEFRVDSRFMVQGWLRFDVRFVEPALNPESNLEH